MNHLSLGRQHHFIFIQHFAKMSTTQGAPPVSLTPVVKAKKVLTECFFLLFYDTLRQQVTLID
jgi:hypothetical protein